MASDTLGGRCNGFLNQAQSLTKNQTTHKTMNLNKKELYLSPEVKTVEVKIVGVVCQSLDGIESIREGYGPAQEVIWE